MHTSYGDMDLDIPRDRNGDYEPQVIKKYQNTLNQDMEEKIISMYAKCMTTGDIENHLNDLYGIDVSDSTISRITDKVLHIVKDILIAGIDGLTGFPRAISAVFPDTEIQHCVIHQIRNSTKFVSYKDIKPLMADLKKIYELHQKILL